MTAGCALLKKCLLRRSSAGADVWGIKTGPEAVDWTRYEWRRRKSTVALLIEQELETEPEFDRTNYSRRNMSVNTDKNAYWYLQSIVIPHRRRCLAKNDKRNSCSFAVYLDELVVLRK